MRPAQGAEFSPDASRLITGHPRPGRVKVWDLITGRQLIELSCAGGSSADAIAFWPDGQGLVACSGEGLVNWCALSFDEIQAADKTR